nr:hypothetical protein [Tanacetum cinerariifolium]
MANENVPAPAPTRSDDQILPFVVWVPIGKSNFVLDLKKKQKNPIFQISVDILQNKNFFRAFTTSASLDEVQFKLDANLLREALEITPIDQAHQFMSPPSDYVKLIWEEFVQAIQTFLIDKANLGSPTKKGKKTKPYVIPYSQFTKLIIYYLERHHNIHQRFGSPLNLAKDDLNLRNLKFIPKGKIDEVFRMQIPEELITNNIWNAPYYNAYLEMVAKHKRRIAAVKEGGKKMAPKADKPVKPTQAKQAKPRRTPTSEEALTRHSAQPHDDTSANVFLETPSLADAETVADTDKVISEGDLEILNIGEEQGKDVDNQGYLEEQTDVLDKGQAELDPVKTLESRPPQDDDKMDEDQAGSDPRKSHVIIEDPPSSSETLSSIKNLDDIYIFWDLFFNDKSIKDEPGKQNVNAEVVSMITVPIHQASTSVPPLSTPIIDLSPSKPTASPLLEPFTAATTKIHTLDNATKNLRSRVFTLKLRDLPHKIDQTVNKVVKEAVPIALQALHIDRFRELSKADMKEILHQRMFKSGSYKSLLEHVALYEALEASMEHEIRDEFLVEKEKSQRDVLVKDVPIPDDVNILDTEDIDAVHLLKIKTRPGWLKPVPKEDRPETPKQDWIIPPMDLPEAANN